MHIILTTVIHRVCLNLYRWTPVGWAKINLNNNEFWEICKILEYYSKCICAIGIVLRTGSAYALANIVSFAILKADSWNRGNQLSTKSDISHLSCLMIYCTIWNGWEKHKSRNPGWHVNHMMWCQGFLLNLGFEKRNWRFSLLGHVKQKKSNKMKITFRVMFIKFHPQLRKPFNLTS